MSTAALASATLAASTKRLQKNLSDDRFQELQDCIKTDDAPKLARLLAQEGYHVDCTNNIQTTALMSAAQFKAPACASALLSLGANTEKVNRTGFTALDYACSSGRTEVVKLLLADGLKKNKEPSHRHQDSSHFYLALRKNHIECVGLLLDHGCDLEDRDENHFTPLLVAAHSEFPALTGFLLERGAQVNAQCMQGNTPLHYACKNNDSGNVERLVRAGADGAALNFRHETPLDMAALQGNIALLPRLYELGFEPSDACDLALKCKERGHHECADYLLAQLAKAKALSAMKDLYSLYSSPQALAV